MSNCKALSDKLVIIVEDESGVLKDLRTVVENYGSAVRVQEATNAGEVLDLVTPKHRRPDALVLDLMMPYGSAHRALEGASDPDANDTGLRVLQRLREAESASGQPAMWVAIITARSPYVVDARANTLLSGCGAIYYKPFDIVRLEDDLMKALGIPSKVPVILLEQDSSEHLDEDAEE